MIKFIKYKDPDNHYDKTTVIIKSESVVLQDILEDFEEFLKACGFNFDGHLDIVSDHDNATEE